MLLNEHEKTIVNRILRGYGYYLGGGSSEIRGDGTIAYHLTINKGSAATMGNALGVRLKKALGADQIFEMGIRIA